MENQQLPDLSYPQYHRLDREDQDRFIAQLAQDQSFQILFERMREQADRVDMSLRGRDLEMELIRAQLMKQGIEDVFRTVQVAAVSLVESEEEEEA